MKTLMTHHKHSDVFILILKGITVEMVDFTVPILQYLFHIFMNLWQA
jgi:hypothetical protein